MEYNLTEYWKENRGIERKRSPTSWLNGRGSHFVDVVNVTRGRFGKTTTESKKAFDDYVDFFKNEPNKRSSFMMEEGALCAVEYLLGVKLIRQYLVEGFAVDGYDAENNVAYEIDEPSHKYQIAEDSERENFIKERLNCKFVRIPVCVRRD